MIKSTKRPRVIANFALTADGKVSTSNLAPTGFTSKTDKDDFWKFGLWAMRSLQAPGR